MKIERAKLKKSNSELPEACRPLRDSLVAAKDDQSMYKILKNVKSWEFGKSELFHWVDVLDMFDDVMERCCATVDGNKWMLACDQPDNAELKLLMLQVMRFTSMLIEYSFQRHSYESMDFLICLLSSSDMDVVHEVLNVLYVFSKRSNFMGRLSPAKKHEIVIRLQYLAESWGGKENGFGLAECCQDLAAECYPSSATTVHFEFYINRSSKTQPSNLCTIHLEHVDLLYPSPSQVMSKVLQEYEVPENKQMLLFTHIRLAHSFSNFKQRTNCILARLQAISVLVYSHAGDNDVAHQIIYSGFINELVYVLELQSEQLIDMKAAVMRTLTAIIHLERNPKLETIIDVTGANTYHGFLPSLVRKCIVHMVEPRSTAFPHSFSTALFSFLYHLASYESGGEALLSCGIMPSLLQLASWHSDEQEHITFVTRAVRIIDLMTNMCTQSFENHNGLKVFIERLHHEVTLCRQEQPYIIRPTKFSSLVSIDSVAMDVSESSHTDSVSAADTPEDGQLVTGSQQLPQDSAAAQTSDESVFADNAASSPQQPGDEVEVMDSQPSTSSRVVVIPVLKTGVQCLPQRSALLKSILNFFKKVIPEPTLSFADSIRHIMEGSMPKALQHIISNAEYYGASLFLLALDVVTVFVFQEPSLLSSLQDNGLTEVVLESLLVKDVPTTREVLAALPNVFSALCLNQRGLDAFVNYKPFEKLFKVLLSPEYLPAMRKRKSTDTFGDTANNLGTAMDELMRHQPSLRVPAIKAIIGLLKEIVKYGTDGQYVCASKATEILETTANTAVATGTQNSSDIESEDDDEVTEGTGDQASISTPNEPAAATAGEVKPSAPKPVPLMDYVHNVMKFVDAIMGNTTSDDHCMEFINQGGLEPLFTILQLPNLPVDFPTSQAFQSVSNVCTVLLKLCHEPQVLQEGLQQLSDALKAIDKLYEPLPPPGGSVLLSELANAVSDSISIPEAITSSTATPLLHKLAAVQAYVKMFVHMCRFGQADLKQISLAQWSTKQGMDVLSQLGKLYFSLVWEGTVLLAVCSDNDHLPADSDFGSADMAKLLPKIAGPKDMDTDSNSSVGVTAAMEGLSTADLAAAAPFATPSAVLASDDDNGEGASGEAAPTSNTKKSSAVVANQLKHIRPLLNVSSRLGSTLAELFQNVLVKLCVGSVMLRQRRAHQQPPAPPVPSANARAISKALCKLSTMGLRWKPPTDADIPKLQMSFLMCSVGFTMPMLFEESKRSYHLMLQEFINSKGQEALFEVFDNVLDQLPPADSFRGGADVNVKLPTHCVEFLDTWLLLAEKMVHPKLILESIYPLPDKGNTSDYVKFTPTDYLKRMLKPVFNSILRLWNHRALTNTKDADASHMAQLEQVAISMLTILGHIIQAEKIIKEKEQEATKDNSKGKSSSAAAASTANAASAQPTPTRPGLAPLSEDNEILRDLMDMGFPRESCVEALNFTSTVEQATEYLITHAVAVVAGSGAHPYPPPMDMSLSEDEQIRAAIELSLTSTSDDTETKEVTSAAAAAAAVISSVAASQPGPSAVTQPTLLTTEDLDNLTENLVAGCMNMLDALPNTVFKICQLVVTVAKRNGDRWREQMFKQLFLEIKDVSIQLSEDSVHQAWGSTKQQAAHYFSKGEKNLKLASRMHLLTLLIQEVDAPCISILQDNGFINSVLDLVEHCLPGFRLSGTSGTPQWLAPIMLIIDQCEKAAVASRRKAECRRVLGTSTAWKWFDDRNGRWCSYNSTSNNVIDAAYKSGETSVRFSAGRRKYLVQFNAMLQLNEETGNRRPVMLSVPSQEERAKNSESSMDTDINSMEGLLPEQIRSLIKCCVDLISVPVECETLHAVLRLCLRCTRIHEMAELFVNCGGVDQLLALSQASSFTGFTSLCTLLIRHVLEDEDTLNQSIVLILKEVTQGVGSSLSGVSSNSMGSKEMHYVMRQLGPVMCRSPDLLKSLAQQHLKISLQNGKEPLWSAQHQVDILTHTDKPPPLISNTPSDTFKKIVTSLLNILIVPYAKSDSEYTITSSVSNTQLSAATAPDRALPVDSRSSVAQPTPTTTSVLEGLLATNDSNTSTEPKITNTRTVVKSANDKKDASTSTGGDDSLNKLLLSKSCVLRMLSEYVRSYPACANLIIQHSFLAGQSDLVNETCTALTFIFDKLLPSNQEDGDKDCPALSRVFLASMASCNHSSEAQTVLVNELRLALQKTLAMPEVTHKYTHIQTLTGLVSTLIDACPGSYNQMKSSLLMKSMPSQTMNQMVKLMVKRGLVSDLARIPHNLDLSNPSSVNTINTLLKPLETLSRIVNMPQVGVATGAVKSSSTVRPPAEQSIGQSPSVPAAAAAAAAQDTTSDDSRPTAQLNTGNGAADDTAEHVVEVDIDFDADIAEDMRMRGVRQVEERTLRAMAAAAAAGHVPQMDRHSDMSIGNLHQELSSLDAEDAVLQEIADVEEQVSEALEQALDEILSQGRSDHSGDEELDRVNAEANLSDIEEDGGEDDGADEDDVAPYHEDEEDDTTDDDDDDDDDDDEDDVEEEGENGANADGGELGMEDDEGWSDEDEMGTGGGLANFLALDDDDDLFSRLEAYDPLSMEQGMGRPRVLLTDSNRILPTLHVPIGSAVMENMNDDTVTVLPPAPTAVPVTHPLMNPSATVSTDVNRSQNRFMPGLTRTRRPAGTGRALERLAAADRGGMNYGLHMMPHHNQQSTFLQRLFGAGVAANILQLTTRLGTGGAGARLYISDEDPFNRTQSEPLSDFFQDGMEMVKNNSGPGILNNIPSTLYRWIEECRVLDGPAVHDVITANKPEIIDHLQAMKKEQIEVTTKKEREAKEKKAQEDQQRKSASNSATPTSTTAAASTDASEITPIATTIGSAATAIAAEASAGAASISDEAGASSDTMELNRLIHQGQVPPQAPPDLLNSMQALFGREGSIPEGVVRLYNRGQELQSLMSVPLPQPHTNSSEERAARTITTSVNDSSRTGLPLFEDIVNRTVAASLATPGGLGGEATSGAPIESSSSSLLLPLLTSSAADTSSAAGRVDNSEDLPLPVTESSAETGVELSSAANVDTEPTEVEEVEQDRACTPPNIFYDADVPAPPPQAENSSDEPVPVSVLSAIAASTVVSAESTIQVSAVREEPPSSATTTLSTLSSAISQVLPSQDTTPVASTSDNTEELQTTVPPQDSAAPSTSSAVESAVGPSDAGGSLTLPPGLEGVDPSFLEALPESIRREVIAEQLRLARIQSQVRENAADASAAAASAAASATASSVPTTTASTSNWPTAAASVTSSTGQSAAGGSLADVSAEFLAALPPAIQEEVLAVQRAEQARQTATESGPDNTQDPGSFLNSLPPSLRQQVLADMDDSQISVLPADLMAEAHLLRGELEDRNRRMQNELFPGNASLGSILRQSGLAGMTASRYMRRGMGSSRVYSGMWPSNSGSGREPQAKGNSVVRRGRQLLDQEGLTCLLVLLFLDEPRLNVTRLHRILKNLGFHNDTLLWIIRALISILIKTNDSKETYGESSQASGKQASQSAWLSFGMDAALGCRANVFQVQHSSSSKRSAASGSAAVGSPAGGNVNIHPQAAQLVCQHVMDTLIYLSKTFTCHFLPSQPTTSSGDTSKDSGATSGKDKDAPQAARSKSPKHQLLSPGSSSSPQSSQTFWDVLIKLDQMRLARKGKGVQRMSTSVSSGTLATDDSLNWTSVEESPLGQLMTLLASPVIRRSPTLTDRLLKLLGNISIAISSESGKPPAGSTRSAWWDSSEGASTNQPRAVVDKSTVLLPNQLKLAVEVLTSKSCSEEGLEDSTRLLVKLSNANQVTKQNIVKLLLSGAQQIGQTVCQHIESLLSEAQDLNKQHPTAGGTSSAFSSTNDLQSLDDADPRPSTSTPATGPTPARGLIPNRFQEGSVVTVAPPKNKARSHELQLPSMSLLTAKSSSQQFLLRLLKVIIQLSDKKPEADSSGSSDSSDNTPNPASAEDDAAGEVIPAEATNTDATAAAVDNSGSSDNPAASSGQSATMEVDVSPPSTSSQTDSADSGTESPLCERLGLEKLWDVLGLCLSELATNSDQNAVLILQPAVETFFLVHAGQQESSSARSRREQHRREDQLSHLNLDEPPPSPATSSLSVTKSENDISPETQKFLKFAETHRTVLNQILRQSQTPLSDGPFSVLVDHMKLLDFDVKNRYFKAELQKLDDGMRREDLAVHVRRDHVFEDSYRELFRRTPEEWKHRLYIVFEGEEGQDAGGLLREWYLIMSREIFNPNYALFMTTPQDRVTYTINQLSYYNSEHLSYFKFVGRIIAKAIYDNKLLECYFTRSFYKHITGQPVRYTDMEAEDYSFYQGLEFLLTHDIKDLGYDLTFSTEIQELGVTQTRELKPNGANIMVTEDNKKDYVKNVCQLKMAGAIRKQLNAFLEGFYDVIPKYLISIFNEQELELLISGLPTVDIDDLKANAEYHKYNANSLQIIWFWRALRSFDQGERARFLQFVTGTSKVPLQGFAYLEGMNGTQKFQIHRDDRSTDRLPCAHTCFNQLDLPAYETFDKLKKMLLLVINECSEGFGLA